MSGLKDSVERADRERKARQIEEQRKNEISQREAEMRHNEIVQYNIRSRAAARQNFNTHLSPLFKEIASAVNASMGSRVEAGLFRSASKSWFEYSEGSRSLDQRYGFDYSTTDADMSSWQKLEHISKGKLIWDYEKVSEDLTVWRYIEMGVTSLGLVIASFCPPDTNVLSGGYKTLYSGVEKVLTTSRGEYGSHDTSPSDVGGI